MPHKRHMRREGERVEWSSSDEEKEIIQIRQTLLILVEFS